MIEVTNLQKRFGALQAVAGVSFTVQPGEVFGLLGPNGAGKTTTLHMLAGLLRPDAGAIAINGQHDPTARNVRRQLGLCPQALALYDPLTAEENLNFFGRLYGLSGTDLHQRVQWSLDLAGLTERRHDRVGTFSGGMKRRLNLASALVHDPPVVFLDEPTVGVDPQSRNYLFEAIEKLVQDGRSLLYTTHYMEEAQRLCQRVAIMDAGKILALDTVPGLIATHGGAAQVEVELEETPPPSPALPGKVEGRRWTFPSAKPHEEAARLAQQGHRFTSFLIHRPDLETVFLNLTGKQLRD